MYILKHHWDVVLKLNQIKDLSERTGVCALAFFTRMHIHDASVPSWVDSDGAIAFVSEVLKIEPMEFLARFEQWACTRTKGENCLMMHPCRKDVNNVCQPCGPRRTCRR